MFRRALMESITIRGHLYAKARGAVPASKTRAILPLPSVLTIIDCLLFNYWQPIADELYPDIGSVLARNHTRNASI